MLDRLRRRPLARRVLPLVGSAATVPAAVQALLAWRGRPPLDRGWYAAQGYRWRRGQVAHYLLRGRRAGWSLHPLLEPSWLAPTSWRRPWPEPLAAPDPRRSTHPALAAGSLTPNAVRSMVAATALPGALGDQVRAGALRSAALAAVGLRREQEALRLLARVQPHWRAASAASPPLGRLPSVTVVLPVHERPAQVVDAIASVQAQSHREWQLVVVDDGSTDATPDVVADIARLDPRIELVRARHGGVSAARNLGAAKARGDVLAWLDSDNTWAPDYLRQLLGALASSGAESAYAVLEQHDDRDGVAYRALDAGADALAVKNHIDLNVLVARRAAVEQVGGFDESLRRAVDYDLVLRLAGRSRPLFVPVLGARYDARREAADRVTVREAKTWSDVVRARRLVDWAALAAGVDARVADRLSVVLTLGAGVPAEVFVPTALDVVRAARGDVELVVVDAGGSRATGTALAGLAAVSERIRVVRWPAPMTPGWALAHALPDTTGALLAVPDAGTRLDPGYDVRLREVLTDRPVHVRTHLLAARVGDLVAALAASGCVDALDPTPAWRVALAARTTGGAGGVDRAS